MSKLGTKLTKNQLGKKQPCKICGNLFFPRGLKGHEATHKGETPFEIEGIPEPDFDVIIIKFNLDTYGFLKNGLKLIPVNLKIIDI
jgi:hypothetical protein